MITLISLSLSDNGRFDLNFRLQIMFGKLFLLPKMHKHNIKTFNKIENNGFCNVHVPVILPGRPVISQIETPTERSSQ